MGTPRVLGFGGFFFRANDPQVLSAWYERALGVGKTPENEGDETWTVEGGPVAFQPFDRDSDMFGDAQKSWKLNFRVDDLDAMVTHLQSLGVAVEVDPQAYSFGRFAELHDPEGNPIQLWQAA